MIDHPASQAIIIIRGHERDTAQPFLVGELVEEGLVLDDRGADDRGAARQAGDASIQVRGRSNFKVPPFEICCAEKFPHVRVRGAFGAGVPTCGSDLGILKCGKDVCEECGAPKDIVVRKNGNRRASRFQALDHLQPFVRFLGAQHLDMAQLKILAQFLDSFHVPLGRHDDDRSGRAGIDRLNATGEVRVRAQRRNDHCDILGGECRQESRTDGAKGPRRYDVDNEAGVPPKPGTMSVVGNIVVTATIIPQGHKSVDVTHVCC